MKIQTMILPIILSLSACGDKHSSEKLKQEVAGPDSLIVRYAKGFTVTRRGNAKEVTVTYPFQGAASGYAYLLVPRGQEPPAHDANARIIYTPLETIVCTSTTHIPLLDYIGETDRLVGFPSTDYISSERMRKRVDSGAVTDLGIDKGLNLEKLAVLNPGAVMGYTMSGDYGQFRKIESLGIPVVINAEYLEQHPLGRAEWIKFTALFFNREREADSVFNAIEENYLRGKAIVTTQSNKPTVLSGIVYGDAWFLPGGQNYAAQLFSDAGCSYLWEDTDSNGYLHLPFETVYEKAHDADLWIGTGSFKTLEEIRAADGRCGSFHPFGRQNGYIYEVSDGFTGGIE
jgi:iron complex transport system substrate-binding protein